MTAQSRPVGDQLREWRLRRRLSQLALAGDADISTRHLSFMENGRAQPSREMIAMLADRLEVPLRERNVLLTAAGYAPAFPERGFDDPALDSARKVIDMLLRGHEPYPALAVDRHWVMRASNAAVAPLLAGVDAALLRPPVNVLRLSLHPQGLAARIVNLPEWREHLLERLRRQVDVTADATLTDLLRELSAYPSGARMPRRRTASDEFAGIAVPLELRVGQQTLRLLSTTTVFGTPVDILLSELALESFFPADAETAAWLRQAAVRR